MDSVKQHKKLAVELKGVQQQRTISEAFAQTETGNTLVSMFDLNLIVGSGGVLSHATRRQQSMFMMIDAFLPEGAGSSDCIFDSIVGAWTLRSCNRL